MNKKLEIVIAVVGCGGTGGKLATELFRMLACFKSEDVVVKLALIDGDRVEAKNIERQPFSTFDVGAHKCLALQEAARECFDIEVGAYPTYLDTTEQLYSIIKNESQGFGYYSSKRIIILCGCVDNHRARQVLEDYFKENANVYYIDSANEFDVGEVVYGIKLKGKLLSPSRAYYFPEVLTDKGKRASEQSCSEINVSSPQHPGTNMMAANLCLTAISNFLVTGKMRNGIVFFNALDLSLNHRAYEEE